MELNTNQIISNEIISSLQKIPKYNQTNFVDDCLKINTILNSELRNQSDFKSCLNLLRSILRDNKVLFCPLFQNLINKYLSIIEKENIVPDEYVFLLVDILDNKLEIKKYYKKWNYKILATLMAFSGINMNEKNNEQISKICKYIQFWFDKYIASNDDCINSFVNFFDSRNLNLQKISAFYFFKYVYLYDINKIKLIDWKNFFARCCTVIEDNLSEEDNKVVVKDIFQQIYIYFQKLNVDPNDALIEGNSLNAAKYFEQFNGFNTERAKEHLRLLNIV
jgi:hypothetical protein